MGYYQSLFKFTRVLLEFQILGIKVQNIFVKAFQCVK